MPIVIAGWACWVGRVDFVMLIGGDVIRSTDASIVIWGVAVLAGLGLLAATLIRPPQAPGRRVVVGAVLAITLAGTGAWCVGQAVVIDVVAALGVDSYTVVHARASGGCALVVHENGALRTSSGQVYAVGPWGFAHGVGSWTADEIALPVRDGTYSLRWRGGAGELTLGGDHTPRPDRLQLTCG